MTCPFYGMHDRGLGEGVVGVLRPSHGNQCALVRPGFSPCRMEMARLRVEWRSCLYRTQALSREESPDCIRRCVACHRTSHICDSPSYCYASYCDAEREELCPACLHRVCLARRLSRHEPTLAGGLEREQLLDEINAFRAGYRHGADYGIVSPREAETVMRQLGWTTPITSELVDLFCNGADDGARGDKFRYLLSFACRHSRGDSALPACSSRTSA